ncbi:Protein of unknown function [Arsukibacterium tuosuense]|uniref:DUF2982 domain-containing protein n=1 Tax=Arsukibacterium tuosuense TaxID=1323745 RepID=A0A285IHH0_9GAMM|nr:DUF2982 domain-containing protein [Arsukibacterium tuosuense]SNY46391.1 Protein of unknown function [Arsukibacterium tuosuense]
MEPILVSQTSHQGGARLLLSGAGALLGLVLFTVLFAGQFSLWLAIAYIAAAMAIFLGFAKLAEPRHFLKCDEQGVHYYHRYGSWLLPWNSFMYCAVPQLEQHDLSFIGFKVTDYDAVLQPLRLRLAVRLMTEQRPLFISAVKQGCATGQCASELLAEKDTFATENQQYSGIKAVFGQRMLRLAQASGFDLFVPSSLTAEQTSALCQQINRARLQIIQNTAT